jgi:peptide-methionine (S)-S-oxide reductase
MPTETAYFAAGCFWGVEHAFHQVPGVLQTKSGYMNGQTASPTYDDVCRGNTFHAEAVEVVFNSDVVRYDQLLWLFWHLHDPTQVNRQGPDVGTQYRSGVYTVNQAQHQFAEASKSIVQRRFTKPIATEIQHAQRFWPAEDYHQQYFMKHPWRGSCHALPDIQATLLQAPPIQITHHHPEWKGST